MKKIKYFALVILTMVIMVLPINNAKAEEKINVYLFWGDGCPHCEEAIKFFNSIEDEYGKYYKLVKYEVWNDQDNSKLMDEVASKLKEQVSGVPYIVIGNKTFNGYAESYDDQIKEAIKNAYESDSYKDVVKQVKDGKKDEKESSPVIPIIIVASISILVIGGLVVLTKKM